MRVRHQFACLSAAVISVVYGGGMAHARDLVWDASGNSAPTGTDGLGSWDNSSSNWIDALNNTVNTSFSSATPDSARFGLSTTATGIVATPIEVLLNANITAQDITLATAANGAYYSILDQADGGQTLTLNGNIIKAGAVGAPQFQLTNGLVLSAGNHVIVVRDSPNDAPPELSFNSALVGAGSITIDNRFNSSGYEQYGTTLFGVDNSYTGGTTIKSGRLVLKSGGGLGTGATVVSDAGMLSIGGAGIATGTFAAGGDLSINTSLQITRNDYGSTVDFSRYTEAVTFANDGSSNTHTLNGTIDVASTDARLSVNTNRLVLNSTLTASVPNAVLSIGGDFAGFVQLTQDNTAFAAGGGAFRFRGGVEIEASSEANLGGPTSKLLLSGGTIRPLGALGAAGSAFMTNFGAHDISGAPVNTGLNLDASQTFTVNDLSGQAIGTRGTGTIVFNGTNVYTGTAFYDGGTVNVNGATTFGRISTRNANVNVGASAAMVATAGIYITTDGSEVSKLTQNGGSISSTRGGQFGLTIGGRATNDGNNTNAIGTYDKLAGTLSVTGETFIGNRPGTTGIWNHAGGDSTLSSWLTLGRGGSTGTLDLSAGTILRNGGGNTFIDEGNDGTTSTMTIRGSGALNIANGEFWVGQGGGTGILNVQSGSIVGNSWMAIGRESGKGTVNLSGGTFTKQGGNWLTIGGNGTATGTFLQTGGTFVSNATFLGETSTAVGTMTLSGGTTTFNGQFFVGLEASAKGTLNVNAGATATAGEITIGERGAATGTVNLNGGTLNVGKLRGVIATGGRTVNFNGTQVVATGSTADYIVGLTAANVGAGGAKINSNGFIISSGQVLQHDATLGATADGGLTKSGAGTLTLTGANTYTGNTFVTAGTLAVTYSASAASAATPLLSGPGYTDLQGGRLVLDHSASTSPITTVRTLLAAGYPSNFASGQIRATNSAANPARGIGYAELGGGQLALQSTFYGDATLDGIVNVADLGALATNYGATDAVWAQGDFNYDAAVSVADLGLLATYYGSGTSLTAAGAAAQFRLDLASVAASNPEFAAAMGIVPEPTTLAAAGLAALAFGRRRRRAV